MTLKTNKQQDAKFYCIAKASKKTWMKLQLCESENHQAAPSCKRFKHSEKNVFGIFLLFLSYERNVSINMFSNSCLESFFVRPPPTELRWSKNILN